MAAERWLERFLEAIQAERDASRNTLVSYARDLTDFAAFLAPRSRDYADAGRADIEAYLVDQADRGMAEATRARGIPGRIEGLPIWIVVANVAAIVLCLLPMGCFAGFPLGVLATVLVQAELNRLADLAHVAGTSPVAAPPQLAP